MTSQREVGPEQALVEAIAVAAERLLRGSDPPPIPEVLGTLGVAAGLSRLVLVAARWSGRGSATRMEGRQQWTAPGIARLGPDSDGWRRYPARWSAELERGTTIAGPTRSFPADERAALDAVGVRSAMLIPVVVGDEWYGHLACHDCRAERTWGQAEVDALRATATIMGSAIHQRRIVADAAGSSMLLRSVGSATSLLLEAQNWRQALPRVLDSLRTATRARGAWAYGPDPEAPASRAILLYEVLAPGARPGVGRARVLDLPAGAAERLQTTGTLHDGMDDAVLGPLRGAFGMRAGSAWAVAPMIVDPGAVGAVGLESEGHRSWTDGELEGLEIIAAALKAAIRRSGVGVAVPIVPNPWGRSSGVDAARIGGAAEPAEVLALERSAPGEDPGNPG